MALPILPIATTLFGIGQGILGGIKANRIDRMNTRPTATVNSNLVKNVGDAAIAAQTGLTDQTYNNALNQLNTGLNVGTRQIGRMGGTSSVASTLRAFGQGVNNLAAQDQQARQQNQYRLANARTALAQDQQRVFNWNQIGRYQELAQRAAQLRGASQQNLFNGLTTLSTLTQPTGDSSTTSATNYPVSNPLALQQRYDTLNNNIFNNQMRAQVNRGFVNPLFKYQ